MELHDRLLEEAGKSSDDTDELIRNLAQRTYQLESRLDLKSKETNTTSAYTNEKLTLMVEGLLQRERVSEERVSNMARDFKNAMFTGIFSLIATFIAGLAITQYSKPARAVQLQSAVVTLQPVEYKVVPLFCHHEQP